jgi:hypothetical protein
MQVWSIKKETNIFTLVIKEEDKITSILRIPHFRLLDENLSSNRHKTYAEFEFLFPMSSEIFQLHFEPNGSLILCEGKVKIPIQGFQMEMDDERWIRTQSRLEVTGFYSEKNAEESHLFILFIPSPKKDRHTFWQTKCIYYSGDLILPCTVNPLDGCDNCKDFITLK